MKRGKVIESKMNSKPTSAYSSTSQISMRQQGHISNDGSSVGVVSTGDLSMPITNVLSTIKSTHPPAPTLCRTDIGVHQSRTVDTTIQGGIPCRRTSIPSRQLQNPLTQQQQQQPPHVNTNRRTSGQLREDLLYLKERKICDTLEFIVRSLLTEQPEDPILAICNMLRQSNRSGSSVRVSVNQGLLLSQQQPVDDLDAGNEYILTRSSISSKNEDVCVMSTSTPPNDDSNKQNSFIRGASSQRHLTTGSHPSQRMTVYTRHPEEAREELGDDQSIDDQSISRLFSHNLSLQSEKGDETCSLNAEEIAHCTPTPTQCSLFSHAVPNLEDEDPLLLRDVSCCTVEKTGDICDHNSNKDDDFPSSVPTDNNNNNNVDNNTMDATLTATNALTCLSNSDSANKLNLHKVTAPLSLRNLLPLQHNNTNNVAMFNRTINSRVNTPSSASAVGKWSMEPTTCSLMRNSRLEREDSTKSEMSMFSVASVDMIEFLWEFRSAHASLFGLGADGGGRPYISINDLADIVDRVSIPFLDVRLIVDLFNDLAIKDAAYYYHRYKNVPNDRNNNIITVCDARSINTGDEMIDEGKGHIEEEKDVHSRVKHKYGASFEVLQQAAQGGHEPALGLVSFDAFIARMNYKIQGRYPVELLRTVFFSIAQSTDPSPNKGDLPVTPVSAVSAGVINLSNGGPAQCSIAQGSPHMQSAGGYTANSTGIGSQVSGRGFANRIPSTASSIDLYVTHCGGSISGSVQAASTSSVTGTGNNGFGNIPSPVSLTTLSKTPYITISIRYLSDEALWSELGIHHSKTDIEKTLSRLNIKPVRSSISISSSAGAAGGVSDNYTVAAPMVLHDEGCQAVKDRDATVHNTVYNGISINVSNAAETKWSEECNVKDTLLNKMGQSWETMYKLNVNDFVKVVQHICSLHPELM